MVVKPIPDGWHTIVPYLTITDAEKAMAFYVKAFGAVEILRLTMPDGKIGHAEMRIGDSVIMLADTFPQWGNRGPIELGGSPVAISLHVPDADKTVAAAVAAGATIERPLTDQFYGERQARLKDPFGHTWVISTHIEDVTQAEMQRRMDEWLAQSQKTS